MELVKTKKEERMGFINEIHKAKKVELLTKEGVFFEVEIIDRKSIRGKIEDYYVFTGRISSNLKIGGFELKNLLIKFISFNVINIVEYLKITE